MLLYNLFSGMFFRGHFVDVGGCMLHKSGVGNKLIAVLALLMPCLAEAKLQILASIKPLALIAREVAGEKAEVDTLLPVTASPHDYPLKMSDHRRLREAGLVIWVGPELESFLARSLANLSHEKVISAYHLAGIHWPDLSNVTAGHQHANHQHRNGDPHLWLDPRNAEVIAQAVAAKLAGFDPQSASDYRANAARFVARVRELDQRLNRELGVIRSEGFAVYHEGYSHFVSRYGLHQVGYVTYTPERRPGAKHLKELENVLEQEGKCLFVEPYYQVESIENMARSLGLHIGVLDPIGDQQVSSYQSLLEKLASSFLACLADADRH